MFVIFLIVLGKLEIVVPHKTTAGLPGFFVFTNLFFPAVLYCLPVIFTRLLRGLSIISGVSFVLLKRPMCDLHLSAYEKSAKKVLSYSAYPVCNDLFECCTHAGTHSILRSILWCVNIPKNPIIPFLSRIVINQEHLVTDFLPDLS